MLVMMVMCCKNTQRPLRKPSPSAQGFTQSTQRNMYRKRLSDQNTGGARHGGRTVTSATDGIETVKDISEQMSACERSGSEISKKGIARWTNSQIEHEFLMMSKSGVGSE